MLGLARGSKGSVEGEGTKRTQRPNLSGDVLELADTLGYGVGCTSSIHVGWRYAAAVVGLPPCSSFCHVVSINSRVTVRCGISYRHRVAHAHRLPHEELGARAHGSHARRLHSHHACRLHRQGPGSFEHVGGVCVLLIGVESGELASWLGDR